MAVAQEKFHCIILKGGDQHPYFPKPLLTEFELRMPVSSTVVHQQSAAAEDGTTAAAAEGPRLEESYMRNSLMHSLLADATPSQPTHTLRSELARRELEVDKVLLQLINVECREGEERGMKALELVNLLSDANGRMVEAAGKVAARYGHTVLGEKIAEVAERRLLGEVEEVE